MYCVVFVKSMHAMNVLLVVVTQLSDTAAWTLMYYLVVVTQLLDYLVVVTQLDSGDLVIQLNKRV